MASLVVRATGRASSLLRRGLSTVPLSRAAAPAASSVVLAGSQRAGGRSGGWSSFAAAAAAAAGLGAAALASDAGVAHADNTHGEPNDMILFSGNANPELAAEIATLLGTELGNITVARFADGEVNVQVRITDHR
jgi:hypothetical protein